MDIEIERPALTAHGEITFSEDRGSHSVETLADQFEETYAQRDCTILWSNGRYQKPNINVTRGQIGVTMGQGVQRIQLRHVSSGAIRFYTSGTYRIPNGEYVLSLWGSTFPGPYIMACVSYQ
jgi:hypothetical protein